MSNVNIGTTGVYFPGLNESNGTGPEFALKAYNYNGPSISNGALLKALTFPDTMDNWHVVSQTDIIQVGAIPSAGKNSTWNTYAEMQGPTDLNFTFLDSPFRGGKKLALQICALIPWDTFQTSGDSKSNFYTDPMFPYPFYITNCDIGANNPLMRYSTYDSGTAAQPTTSQQLAAPYVQQN